MARQPNTTAVPRAPDAALLAVCAIFQARRQTRIGLAGGNDKKADAAFSKARDAEWRAYYAVVAFPDAQTDAGRAAKAGVAFAITERHIHPSGTDLEDDLLFARKILGEVSKRGVADLKDVALSDAALIAACERFHKADAARVAEDDRTGVSDDRGDELDAEWDAAFEAVAAKRPTTPEGLKAQAAVAACAMRWAVKAMRNETWEAQADPWERLAIDCLTSVAQVLA